MIVSEEQYLAHYGILGMKWGIRKNRKPNNKTAKSKAVRVLSKKGENVDLHQQPLSTTAKVLSSIMPSIKNTQAKFSDYNIYSKDGKKVGTISTNIDSKTSMNIIWLSVKPKHNGKGYGQSAMRTIIDDAKKRGFKNITLEVPTNSPNARHIYEKLGFKQVGNKMISDENDIWGGLTAMKLDLK